MLFPHLKTALKNFFNLQVCIFLSHEEGHLRFSFSQTFLFPTYLYQEWQMMKKQNLFVCLIMLDETFFGRFTQIFLTFFSQQRSFLTRKLKLSNMHQQNEKLCF